MATSALPETVSVLTCPNGSRVFLVGTSHFSRESAEDVRRTIRQVRPDVILVELCRSRRAVLSFSEEKVKLLAKKLSWQHIQECIRQEGFVSAMTQLIFVKISNDVMDKLGVAPGGEFRAAYSEAVRLGIPICFGDRAIDVTIKRLLYSLSLRQQFQFTCSLLLSAVSNLEITAEEVERMKNQDMIALLMGELSAEFSTLTTVLVDERDRWLAHSLSCVANCLAEPHGRAVRVVGVVGIGHVKGIKENWMRVMNVDELKVIPKPPLISTVFWAYVRYGIQSLLTVGIYVCGRASLRYLCNIGLRSI